MRFFFGLKRNDEKIWERVKKVWKNSSLASKSTNSTVRVTRIIMIPVYNHLALSQDLQLQHKVSNKKDDSLKKGLM